MTTPQGTDATAAPCVRVVVATYKRADTLARLLASLAPLEAGLCEAIIVDNADDAATAAVVARSPIPARRIVPGRNLSCGGGVKLGLETALAEASTTHCWLFDDDAEACPGALKNLLAALRENGAGAAVPLVLNDAGKISWPPGLLEPRARDCVFKQSLTPAEYRAACGTKPVTFSWSPWPTLLLTRQTLEVAGLPREDFWLCAEDLEFTLRVTAQFAGVFVPTAECRHLPPASTNPSRADAQHYLKFLSLLQNLSYITLRLPHARRALRHLPGNYVRFLKTFGVSPRTVADMLKAFWWGGVRGLAGGMPGSGQFRDRYYQIP